MNNFRRGSDMAVHYGTIEVTSAASGGGIFNGYNSQFGWSAHGKKNTGLGSIGGNHNQIPCNINFVDDTDVVDATIQDQDIMWGGEVSI